ncbi:MAG: cysteine desulfurase NifS, partial [Methanobacterium sp.]
FSRTLEASHVILAATGDSERAHGSIRFTFGRYNSMDDADAVADAVINVVENLRKISPLGKS